MPTFLPEHGFVASVEMATRIAGRDFDSIARKRGATHISSGRIDRDIKRLERVAMPVRRLVNKVVAHTERDRRRIGKLKYGQIDAAIDEIIGRTSVTVY